MASQLSGERLVGTEPSVDEVDRPDRESPLRILIVTQYFWPESFRVNELVTNLCQRGHAVTVLTGIPNYPQGRFYPGYGLFSPRTEEYTGARVVRIPMVSRGRSKGFRLALNYFSFAFMASLLGPVRCRDRYDIVFVFQMSPIMMSLPAIVMSRLRKVPLILWVQDLWPQSLVATGTVRSPRILRAVDSLVQWIYHCCSLVLVQSPGFIPEVEARGTPPEKVFYYPNWAEALYRPVEPPEDAPQRTEFPSGFRVLFAGNIGTAQSFETILAAAEQLSHIPDIHWVVLGDGRQKEWVQQTVVERGLSNQVHLLGRRPLEEMPTYFALADALLVSLNRDPAMALTIPSKLQSYLACGRPILASLDGDGARVVQESAAGFVSPSEDAEALAENTLALYRMTTEQRQEMGARGRGYYEQNFDTKHLIETLEHWMSHLVKSAD